MSVSTGVVGAVVAVRSVIEAGTPEGVVVPFRVVGEGAATVAFAGRVKAALLEKRMLATGFTGAVAGVGTASPSDDASAAPSVAGGMTGSACCSEPLFANRCVWSELHSNHWIAWPCSDPFSRKRLL
jgi:hypothetical protein